MNLKKAKRLRKYIKNRLPFCTEKPLYLQNEVTGQVVLAEQCQRHHYQRTKKNLKRMAFNV